MRTLLMVMILALGTLGCDDSSEAPVRDMAMAPADLTQAPPDLPPANFNSDMLCFDNPTTHVEIINSCAEGIERIEKNPELPKLNPDGTRPPLP